MTSERDRTFDPEKKVVDSNILPFVLKLDWKVSDVLSNESIPLPAPGGPSHM